MEVAFICLHEINLELIGIIDDSNDKQGKKIFGFSIQDPGLIKVLKPDVILVTSIRYRDKIIKSLNKNKELSMINICSI